MHELLLNRSKFTNHLSSVCTRDERVLQVQKLLQTIENQIANGVHTPATITVIDDKEISDSSYNHPKNIPESKEDEQMLHSNFDECTQITEQYNDEMDVDCL